MLGSCFVSSHRKKEVALAYIKLLRTCLESSLTSVEQRELANPTDEQKNAIQAHHFIFIIRPVTEKTMPIMLVRSVT